MITIGCFSATGLVRGVFARTRQDLAPSLETTIYNADVAVFGMEMVSKSIKVISNCLYVLYGKFYSEPGPYFGGDLGNLGNISPRQQSTEQADDQ